jgi:NAD(P)-dependent dehydrogenase (short-subunit alcohol dehydrogenase family)
MTNSFSIEGKRFLITGATSGIGLECCRYIKENGGTFVGIGRNIEHFPYKDDQNKIQFIDLLDFQTTDLNFLLNQKFDGIVHSAGMVELLPIQFFNLELYRKISKINVESILEIISFFLKNKLFNKYASIVLISSISGKFGMKGNGIYGMTKASLDLISKVLAGELAQQKVRTNSILPGMVKTKMTDKTKDELGDELLKIDEKKYPLGYGEIENVVLPIAFLLSDASRWISGQNIVIDGGRTSVI